MAIDPNQLSQDKTFLGMQPEDQRGYLSSQDDTFAKMSPDDQNGYIQHLTGRTPLPPAPTLPGGGALPGVAGPKTQVQYGEPSAIGSALNSLASNNYQPTPGVGARAQGEATEAYHHPLEALKGVAKGLPGVMSNVIPSLQSEPVDKTTLSANPHISQRVKDLLTSQPEAKPQDLSGGIVSGIMQPQNTAQQAGSDLAGVYAAAEGGRRALQALPGLVGMGVREGVPGAQALQAKVNPPEANIAPKIYTPEGNAVAGSMRSNSHFDMPAEAARAVPALKEAAGDLGVQSKDFQGMNGPAVMKRVANHAIDINEARNVQAIDPVRTQPVDITHAPELTELLGKKNPTVGDVDAFRLQANKKLAKSGYYGQSPSQQYSAGPDLAKLEAAAQQARDAVYGSVYDHTGVDIRPSKQTEASLIKLNDVANSTNNTLAQQEAKFKNAPALQKIVGQAKMMLNPKSLVTNAFEPTMSSPTNEFNRNMQNVFQDVRPTPGSIMKNGKLVEPSKGVLTPTPGAVPPEPNRQLPLSLEPGEYGFNLAPPPGQTPAAPSSQFGLPGIGPGGADLHIPPQPTLPGSTPLPRSLGAAAAAPAEVELPQQLREAAGLERRNTPRSAPMSATELEDAIKRRKPITTPFDQTEGARATVENDKNMPKMPGRQNTAPQGGHAGGGVASIEEINRPGKNYVVSKQGKLTYHGKSFAPEETPAGGAHVTVLPDGKFRVNEGTLTPTMATALKNGLK